MCGGNPNLGGNTYPCNISTPNYYLTQQDNYPLSTALWKQDLRRSWPIEGLWLSLRAEVHLPEATYDEKFVVGVGTVVLASLM